MKNIFQNNSIKKAAAAGMIAAQISISGSFLSESFVDKAFAEQYGYSAWNSSIFEDLVPDYSGNLDVNNIESSSFPYSRCILDSENILSLNPKAYSVESRSFNLDDVIKFVGDQYDKVGFANTIELTVQPSLDGIYPGLATTTYNYGVNYNNDMTISINLMSPNPGSVSQITGSSFDYTPNATPTFSYATGTYTSSNGLGQSVSGVVVYNNYIDLKRVQAADINYNSTNNYINFVSNLATDIVTSPINGTILNSGGSYFYNPNPGYSGQDYFTIRDIDYYISVLQANPINGFEGGNFELESGISELYSRDYNSKSIGNFRFYKSRVLTNISNYYSSLFYKLEAPTTTVTLPQLLSNGSSTTLNINTLSSFYNDNLRTPSKELFRQHDVVVEHNNRAPTILPTSPINFVVSSSTGLVPLSSDYKDLEGDSFDLNYEVSNDNFATILATSTNGVLATTTSATSSNTNNFVLPVGAYQYRVRGIEINPTQNCIGYNNASGLKIASSTSTLRSFTVSNASTIPTTTPTTTPIILPLITPEAPAAPQGGGLLPIITIIPVISVIIPTTTPTTTPTITPIKQVLGLNPEDSDDLLPGETPAAYLIRMEKRRVLGRSGSRDLLVETGYNSTLKIFAGVTLLAGVMLLINKRREKRGKLA